MRKRILTVMLVIIQIFSALVPFALAEEQNYENASIRIDNYGYSYEQCVLKDTDGTVFAPIQMLTSFGGMACREEEDCYVFYYPNEAADELFAKRILIDKSGKSAKLICYISNSEYETIALPDFSASYTVNGVLYLPLTEFLPLLDAKTEITRDGVVHVYRYAMPFFSALYGMNLDLWAFDAQEDIVGALSSGAAGMIVDSFFNFRFDQMDFITHSDEGENNKKIFKALLADDKVYLSAYDQEETPEDRYSNLISNALGDAGGEAGKVKDTAGMLEYMTNSDLYPAFEAFAKDVPELEGILNQRSDAAEAAYRFASYYSAYVNQVEDHRNMLDAVYGGDYYDQWDPICVAALQASALYGCDTADRLVLMAQSTLQNYSAKEFSKAVISKLRLTPYQIAASAVKTLMPVTMNAFSDSAKLFYMDEIVRDACGVFHSRKTNMSFEEERLDDLRLSAILALTASRYAYETFMDDGYWALEYINERLERLYLAADSVECVSRAYYESKKAELGDACQYLQTGEYTPGPDETEATDPVEKEVVFYWNNPTNDYENCDIWLWYEGVEGRGYRFQPCDYGGVASVTLPASTTQVGFLVRRDCSDPGGTSWAEATKDVEEDRYVALTDPVTVVYLRYMDPTIYSDPADQADASLDGHRYKFYEISSITTWEDARDYCAAQGGHLAIISSQEENDLLYQLMVDQGRKNAYFGISDAVTEGIWIWVDGTSGQYTNWHAGEPNSENDHEDYGMFYWKYTDGTWNDGDFGNLTNNGGRAFICEWEDETPEGSAQVPDESGGLITVPDVVGMEQIEAVQLLDGLGLQFQVWWASESDTDGDPLYILAQSVEAGAQVPAGTLVRLQLSKDKP